MTDSEKNIRAFLAIEPSEDVLQAIVAPAGKTEAGNQRPDQLDKAAGTASDVEIFWRYFNRRM